MQQFPVKYELLQNMVFDGAQDAVDVMSVLRFTSIHKPSLQRRVDKFPAALKPLLKQKVKLINLLVMLQLHPAIDNARTLRDFAARYDDHTAIGFLRMMFVFGRYRHQGVLDYFIQSQNPFTTPTDVENMKRELSVDLSDIEKTYELSTLPADNYLRNSRVAELFGTAPFDEWCVRLPSASTFKEAVELTTKLYKIGEYSAKNILLPMRAAGLAFPWCSAGCANDPDEFCALGPNPQELCNIVCGQNRGNGGGKSSPKQREVFSQICMHARRFLPVEVVATVGAETRKLTVPAELTANQQLQLNCCKVVQCLDVFYTGNIYNPRRGRS